MLKKSHVAILFGIIFLTAVLRLYHLDSVPPSPYLDEVSNGYNAYSLMLTGKDEYGRHLPLLLQAFNDFRPALFVYTLIPFVKLLGLSIFSIRLPVVILGVVTTLCMFFLTRELLPPTSKLKKTTRDWIALLCSFLYAISPWSIYSSRISDEINMSLSYFIFACTFFLYAMNRIENKKKSWLAFFLSVGSFVITFYSYHGVKFFLPVFIIGISLCFYRTLLKKIRMAVVGCIFAVLLLIPLYIAFTAPGATVRLGAVNVFTQQPDLVSESASRELYDKSRNDRLGEVFDNRRVVIYLEVIKNSLKNLDPSWLFLQQRGNKTFRVPDFGPFYLFELPLLLIGVYFLIKQEGISKKIKMLLLLWIGMSTLPSGISSEAPHLNRTNTMLPAFTILEAMGLYMLLSTIKHTKLLYFRTIAYGGVVVVIVGSFFWFLHAYYREYPFIYSNVYQYGVIQAFHYAKEHEERYKSIVVSNGDILTEGYMYYLFSTHYDPVLYQLHGGTRSAFFTDTHLIGKYDFRNPNMYADQINSKAPKKGGHILYIVNPSELSVKITDGQGLHLVQTYKFINGRDSIWLYEGEL